MPVKIPCCAPASKNLPHRQNTNGEGALAHGNQLMKECHMAQYLDHCSSMSSSMTSFSSLRRAPYAALQMIVQLRSLLRMLMNTTDYFNFIKINTLSDSIQIE